MIRKIILLAGFGIVSGALWASAAATEFRKQQTSLYNDIYEENIHEEITRPLDLSRWGRKLFSKPLRSANVNVFDEVPDSSFFVNRHARERLSLEALVRGSLENDGPDFSNGLTITKAKNEGLHPGFFIKDSKGDDYLVKFDGLENLELATGAEVISSRIYHALGYFVPQYTIATFSKEDIKIGEGARIRDETGFMKPLTAERLDAMLAKVPVSADGKYRVSASKILPGKNKGYFSFNGRRKNDPEDPVSHRDRREIRSLGVFAAWLDNNDARESNTLDMLVEENGKPVLKHYLIDFNSTLGSARGGPKPPTFGYEYFMDYGEAVKAFLTLGFWEKPWQRRWREAGEKPHPSGAVGYFNDARFDPSRYKTQLPYDAFKRLTRADGFWAAKQILAFRDEDIRALVSTGQLSSAEDADYLSKILCQRRDAIARYWLSEAAPLDDFEIRDGRLVFRDLAVEYGFEKVEGRTYTALLTPGDGKTQQEIVLDPKGIAIDPAWFAGGREALLEIRTGEKRPWVRVRFSPEKVLAVRHQD
ncbi:MAG: hypothetical protein ACOY3K_03195 [Candidatus Omnitrophota bacterium]